MPAKEISASLWTLVCFLDKDYHKTVFSLLPLHQKAQEQIYHLTAMPQVGSCRLWMDVLFFHSNPWLHILIQFYFISILFIICVYCKISQIFEITKRAGEVNKLQRASWTCPKAERLSWSNSASFCLEMLFSIVSLTITYPSTEAEAFTFILFYFSKWDASETLFGTLTPRGKSNWRLSHSRARKLNRSIQDDYLC